jgi:ribosomal protein S8E
LCTGATRKTRIIDVVYNASNNELVRTKTLVKNAIVIVDATPFRQWYESHYSLPLGRKKGAKMVSRSPERRGVLCVALHVGTIVRVMQVHLALLTLFSLMTNDRYLYNIV